MDFEEGSSFGMDAPYRARLSRASLASQAENRTPRPSSSRRSRPSSSAFSDRFIPSRSGGVDLPPLRPSSSPPPQEPSSLSRSSLSPSSNSQSQTLANSNLFAMMLRSELLGEEVSTARHSVSAPPSISATSAPIATTPLAPPAPPPTTPLVLRFRPSLGAADTSSSQLNSSSIIIAESPLSPLRSATSRSLLQSPYHSSMGSASSGGRAKRRIPKTPFKILDAPGLADDFYLNNVEWSSRNVIGVGLGSSVYLWSAHTSRATKLDDLHSHANSEGDEVASVSFSEAGNFLAVGTRAGSVKLYDVETNQVLRTYSNAHDGRIGCTTWNAHVLATGSRDKRIRERDTRCPDTHKLLRDVQHHAQEVCGLKYSFEGFSGPQRQLASGGNDNKLYVWDARRQESVDGGLGGNPVHRFADHTAAVKALAWSPHQTGVLASGGGTADRCIKLWSTQTGAALSSVDTGSQVCGLIFSKTAPELVSTHGYSLNQVCMWRAQSPQASVPLQKIGTLQGHTLRVLYLSMSPDGSTIVTGAGDESLRFWSIWPGRSGGGSSTQESSSSGFNLLEGAPGGFLR
ncbi:hypothetical protein BASA81_004159 [Batrachochytrium salamandrivorans]|nr:hypothetical protein BASA81_004159 [Batrachochytrium salamandrivorans]